MSIMFYKYTSFVCDTTVMKKIVDYQNVELFYYQNRGFKTRFVFIFYDIKKREIQKKTSVESRIQTILSSHLLRNIYIAGMDKYLYGSV